jgi:hypothetical protein
MLLILVIHLGTLQLPLLFLPLANLASTATASL